MALFELFVHELGNTFQFPQSTRYKYGIARIAQSNATAAQHPFKIPTMVTSIDFRPPKQKANQHLKRHGPT